MSKAGKVYVVTEPTAIRGIYDTWDHERRSRTA
jgi:hypothetical protein